MTEEWALNYSDMSNPSIVSGNGAFAEFILPNEEATAYAQGGPVIIKDLRDGNTVWLSGSITEIRSLSPFRVDREIMLYNRMGSDDAQNLLSQINGPHCEQRLIAKVKTEIELEKDPAGNFISSPTQRPASNLSKMKTPSINPTDPDMPSIADLLGLKSKGVPIGYIGSGNSPLIEEGEFLPYYLDIDGLDNRHMFIVGESGSGKTVLLKKLALGLRETKIDNEFPRVIMTDVQGDLLQLMMPDIIEPITRTGWQEKLPVDDVHESLESMGPFQLVLPHSKYGDKKQLAAIKKVVKNNGHKVTEVGLRMQDVDNIAEVEYLLRLSSEQAVTVLEDEIEAMKAEKKTITLSNLEGKLRTVMSNNDGEKEVTTSGGTKYYKSTFWAALRGLRHLRDIFDLHEESLRSHLNPLDCLKFNGTTVFYLEHLDREERIMWGMQLVKWLYENKREDGQFFVFIDEAHTLVPAKPPSAGKNGTFPRLRDNFEKLAREGRKFGINLILGTQSPKDLHAIVPEQCPTKVVMKINKGNGKAAELEDADARIASRFSQGQMYLKSPFNGTGEHVRIHSPCPALPHESMTKFWTKVTNRAKRIVKNDTRPNNALISIESW